MFSMLRSETLEFLHVVTGCWHLRGVIRISRSLHGLRLQFDQSQVDEPELFSAINKIA